MVPPVIWLILILGAAVVIASVGFFADRQESAVTQAAMVAAMAIIVVSGLVLVRFLDSPYEDKSGSIKPTAMERTLEAIQRDYREHGGAGDPVRRTRRLERTASRPAGRTVDPAARRRRAQHAAPRDRLDHNTRRGISSRPAVADVGRQWGMEDLVGLEIELGDAVEYPLAEPE